MRYNENTAIAGGKVLLVPYDAHHVPRYHAWMEDAAIREATASDRLTLAEEYENQVSWRTSPDKLTFILCHARGAGPAADDDDQQAAVAGRDDVPDRMVGDINVFLTPWDDDNDDAAGAGGAGGADLVRAEVDVMIAGAADRGRGLGSAAVRALLCFVARHAAGLLREYAAGAGAGETAARGPPAIREFVARIQAGNAGSIALFSGLGFQQRGGVNYFGEVEMVRPASAEWDARARDLEEYREMGYDRSRLPAAAGQ